MNGCKCNVRNLYAGDGECFRSAYVDRPMSKVPDVNVPECLLEYSEEEVLGYFAGVLTTADQSHARGKNLFDLIDVLIGKAV